MNAISPIFFPTQVILVDDDQSILRRLSNQIGRLDRPVRIFSSPFEALDYIESIQQKPLSARLTTQDDETVLSANLAILYKEIFNSNRHNTISTIIADFDMPDMNGIDFLTKVRIPNVQKILLTGVADENLAINAFNNGIINSYIKKQDPKIYSVVETCLSQAQSNFFKRETEIFLQAIKHGMHDQAIMHPDFQDFFRTLLKEKDITEYYLLDSMGSFLFLNKQNNLSILFMFNEETLDYQFDAIEGDIKDSDLSPSDLEDIASHKKAICFNYFDEGNLLIAPKNLSQYVHSIETIKLDNKTYYYALVSAIPNFNSPSKI